VQVIDGCPSKSAMEVWPDLLPSPADAAIVAVALTKRYDAVATFDQKLTKRLKTSASPYW
jgi:hypothetical protein